MSIFLDEKELLSLCRDFLLAKAQGLKSFTADAQRLDYFIQGACGAYVSIYRGDELRGCVGLNSISPLTFRTVLGLASKAGFDDQRFSPVRHSEIEDIDIGIWLIKSVRKLLSLNELHLGVEGLVVVDTQWPFSSATLLPYIARKQNILREDFVNMILEKAHINKGPNSPSLAWKALEVELIGEKMRPWDSGASYLRKLPLNEVRAPFRAEVRP